MCEEVLCFAGCSQSVCAVPEMTDSLPKPPKSPKPPSQSTGGAGTKPKSERGLGGKTSNCAIFRTSKSPRQFPLSCLSLGGGREQQCPPGATCLCPDTHVECPWPTKHIAVNEFVSSDITEPLGLQSFTAWWNYWVLLHHWGALMVMEYLIRWQQLLTWVLWGVRGRQPLLADSLGSAGLTGVRGQRAEVLLHLACPSTAWSCCVRFWLQLIQPLHTPEKEQFRKTHRTVIPSPLLLWVLVAFFVWLLWTIGMLIAFRRAQSGLTVVLHYQVLK